MIPSALHVVLYIENLCKSLFMVSITWLKIQNQVHEPLDYRFYGSFHRCCATMPAQQGPYLVSSGRKCQKGVWGCKLRVSI